MSIRDRLHDRKPEAGALGPPGAGSPAEPLEDALLVVERDARPFVTHPKGSLAALHGRAQRDPVSFGGVLDGVLDELDDCLGQSLAVRDDDAGAAALETPVARPERPGLLLELVRQRLDVHGLEPEEVGLLGLGQKQEVVDDAAHAVELVHHQRDRLAALLRVAFEELEVSPDDRDGRLELVAGIVDEVPLRLERSFEPVEHVVEGGRQVRDLVVPTNGDSPAQIGLRDRPRGRPGAARRGTRRAPRVERTQAR